MIEIMKPIKDCDGYYVSNLGKVYSTIPKGPRDGRRCPPKELKPRLTRNGYCRVYLRNNDGARKDYYIHRLVAEAFLDKQEGKQQVNHIDCDRTNNALSNLEYVSQIENWQHAMKVGSLSRNNETGRFQNSNG